jgi:hypothetical protein
MCISYVSVLFYANYNPVFRVGICSSKPIITLRIRRKNQLRHPAPRVGSLLPVTRACGADKDKFVGEFGLSAGGVGEDVLADVLGTAAGWAWLDE